MPIKHVLIVDDSRTEQMFMSSFLQKNGMTVSLADDAEMAMQQLEQQIPDLILMDVVMPGKNGFQLTRQIKKNPNFNNVPVIICTTKSQETDIAWGMRQGALAYITKPVDPRALLYKIREIEG